MSKPNQPESSPSGRRSAGRTALTVGAIVAIVVAVAVALGLFSGRDQGAAETPAPTAAETASATAEPTVAPTPEPSVEGVAVPDYMIVGDPQAAVTIEIYSDYLCPYCSVYALEHESQLISQLVDTGRAALVYRDFVVVDERGSTLLAVAARAAGEQGRYIDFHAAAMSAQEDIRAGGMIDIALLTGLAEKAQVPDIPLFIERLSAPELAAGVAESSRLAIDAKVEFVPTVRVNGVTIENPVLDEVRAAVEQAG